MSGRHGLRFLLEVVFLGALAVVVAAGRLGTPTIVGVMALGWLIVAAAEWVSWRGEPHFGSGLPPRYLVPRVRLPPPQPLEQVRPGFADPRRDEAPTWIASAALRAELLGGPRPAPEPAGAWPFAAPARATERSEPVVDEAAVPVRLPEPRADLEPPAPPPAQAPAPPRAPLPAVPSAGPVRLARYRFDPLGDPPARRRRLGRRREEETGVIEVPAFPAGPRPAPGAAARPDPAE